MWKMCVAFVLLAPWGWAAHGQLQFAMEGTETPLTFTHLTESPTTFRVVGLPFPGEVLWQPNTQQLAYRHPAEGSWLLATPALLPQAEVATTSQPRAAGPTFQGQPTQRWVQQAGNADCGVLFGSAALGRQQGLTIGDFQMIYRLLYWLNAGMVPPTACGNAQTLAATAPQIGLPTRWASPLGVLVFQGVMMPPDEDMPPAWPRQTYPVTEDVRLRLLLAQLPVPARAQFIRDHATLPLTAQVAKLATLLAEMGEDTPQ
jgi:hypothetical protein